MHRRLNTCVSIFLALCVVNADAYRQDKQPFQIIVIAGEGAVNIIQQKTAVAPIVEVRDRNDLPMAGITVTFSIASGKSATFAGGAQAITITTDAAGRAAASAVTPVSGGAVRIQVTATAQGQTTSITISQTNMTTAPSGDTSGSPGGLSGTAIAGIAGGAAGAAALVLGGMTKGSTPTDSQIPSATSPTVIAPTPPPPTPTPPANRPPSVTTPAFSRPATIPGVLMTFSVSASDAEGDPLTYNWDFGDGGSSAAPSPTYNYQRAGVFMVRVHVRDHESTTSAEAPITVKTLSGLWQTFGPNLPFSTLYSLTQTGTTVIGSWGGSTGHQCPGISAPINPTAPHLVMRVPSCPDLAGGIGTFELSPDADSLVQASPPFGLRRR